MIVEFFVPMDGHRRHLARQTPLRIERPNIGWQRTLTMSHGPQYVVNGAALALFESMSQIRWAGLRHGRRGFVRAIIRARNVVGHVWLAFRYSPGVWPMDLLKTRQNVST